MSSLISAFTNRLPKAAVIDILNIGICPRCVLRFNGIQNFYRSSCADLKEAAHSFVSDPIALDNKRSKFKTFL